MLIVNYLLKSDYRICVKYFTRYVTQQSANSTIFRAYPHARRIAVRLNHDGFIPGVSVKEVENEYYHSYLMKNKKYTATVAFLDYVPENRPRDVNSMLNEAFEDKDGVALIAYLHAALERSQESAAMLDDERFVELCETLTSKVSTLHEDHVLNLLKVMTLWEGSKRNSTFYDMCRTIDKMFLQRYKLWGYDRCLLIMDHFYRLQVLRFSESVWNCMKRLWRNPDRLTSAQVVHAMFLVNAHRVWHPAVHMYNLEVYLHQAAYELSAEECAVMALAFFKTQHRIKNVDLLKVLYQKLFYRISNIDSIPLVSFLKLFKYSNHYRVEDQLVQLLGLLNGVVNKYDYICCTHIVLLGTGLLVWDAPLFDKIAQKFINEISTLRIKDIERTLLAFNTFNYESKTEPDVYKVAAKELVKRKNEVFEYTRPFYSAVEYLSLKGYYNFDLIEFLLSEDVIKKAFNRKELTQFNCDMSVLTISDSIQIDFPEYSGNLLKDSLKKDLYLAQSWKIPKETARKPLSQCDSVLFQIRSVLRDIFGGPEFVHYTYVLPHLARPDLVFRLKGDTPVKLPEDVLSSNFLHAEIPSKTEDWYVLTFLGNNTVIRRTGKPIGNTLAKLRHLRKLGYKVLCVRDSEWLNKSKDEQADYLSQLLKDCKRGNQPEVQQPIRVELQ